MSDAWAGGSSRRWRAWRLYVLNRDAWVCQLCRQPIDPTLGRDDPMAPQVHHTLGRAVTGDDPRFMVAAHRTCNLKARTPPQPRKVSRW